MFPNSTLELNEDGSAMILVSILALGASLLVYSTATMLQTLSKTDAGQQVQQKVAEFRNTVLNTLKDPELCTQMFQANRFDPSNNNAQPVILPFSSGADPLGLGQLKPSAILGNDLKIKSISLTKTSQLAVNPYSNGSGGIVWPFSARLNIVLDNLAVLNGRAYGPKDFVIQESRNVLPSGIFKAQSSGSGWVIQSCYPSTEAANTSMFNRGWNSNDRPCKYYSGTSWGSITCPLGYFATSLTPILGDGEIATIRYSAYECCQVADQ
jgi:hypothetical protein